MYRAPTTAFVAETAPASFLGVLERRYAAAGPRRKGIRTRERLRIGAARALAEKGYDRLRVADIAAAAGVSAPDFYVHYRNKTDAALRVMRPFVGLAYRGEPFGAPGSDPAEGLRRAFARLFAVFHDNRGLVRCLDQLGDEVPRFAALVETRGRRWHERVIHAVLRLDLDGAVPAGGGPDVALALASMTAGVARRIARDPDMTRDQLAALADRMSEIWLRSLAPANGSRRDPLDDNQRGRRGGSFESGHASGNSRP